MYAFQEQFSRAAQAAFDAHMASVANLYDWQRDTALASIAAMTAASNEFLTLQTPEDFIQLAASQGQQAMDRAQAYSREATEVAMNKPMFR